MTAKNAEAAPVCCRSNSFVLVCECFSCSRSSSMQQAVVLLIWRAEKDEKEPESWGARVKSSGCHDWDILHNAARSKNGELEPGILIGNSYTWPWASLKICSSRLKLFKAWCRDLLNVNNVLNSWSWIIMWQFECRSRRGFVTMLISGMGGGCLVTTTWMCTRWIQMALKYFIKLSEIKSGLGLMNCQDSIKI